MTINNHPNLLDRLLERCQQGDLQAFDQLAEAQMERIYRLAATIVRDDKDAEDIVQETLLRVFRQIKTYRREASFQTWLTTITVNVCRDHLRRQKLRRMLSLDWLQERADPQKPSLADQVDQRLQNQALWQQVDRLEDKYRLPLLLIYREHLSADEAAQALGLPRRTLYAHLKAAYEELSHDPHLRALEAAASAAAGLDGERW